MNAINANATGETDGSMYNFLAHVESEIPIIIISRPERFVFNDALLTLDRFVLADVGELGWDMDFNRGTHFFGKNTNDFLDKYPGEQWRRFDEWISANSPILYLKREMLAKDQTDYYQPLNYPALYAHTIESKDTFNRRPLEAIYTWGLSHEERKRLHGQIWIESGKRGYVVGDNVHRIEEFIKHESNPRKWFTANIPHYSRWPMEHVMMWNELAKISVSMPGAGRICFRHTEASSNAVMLTMDDGMAFSFPWIANENCLKFKNFGDEIQAIEDGLNNPDLYEIYLKGVENCNKYFFSEYKTHIEKLIAERV